MLYSISCKVAPYNLQLLLSIFELSIFDSVHVVTLIHDRSDEVFIVMSVTSLLAVFQPKEILSRPIEHPFSVVDLKFDDH